MTRIAILGATGYTALELIKILLRHPGAEIVAVTSRQEGQPPIAMIHPSLTDRLDLRLEDLAPAEIAARAECVFSCLPHGASSAVIPHLLAAGTRVVDFSADYRLNDAGSLRPVVRPEAHRPRAIGQSRLRPAGTVPGRDSLGPARGQPGLLSHHGDSGPGALVEGRLDRDGRHHRRCQERRQRWRPDAQAHYHYPECNESISAYNIGRHRHTPEIDQILSWAAGKPVEVIFTPQLVPMDRGILTTAYARPTGPVSEEQLMQTLDAFYADEPFVRVVEHLPGTKDCAMTNYCDITARLVRGRVMTISCIDNLIKGAAGAAVQNFNLMFGYPETTAL